MSEAPQQTCTMSPGALERRWAYAGLGLLACIDLLVALWVKGSPGLVLLALLLVLHSLALWLFQRLVGSYRRQSQAWEALEQENAFLRQAVGDAGIGLIFVDSAGDVSHVNDTLAGWLGLTPQDLVAHHSTAFVVFHPLGSDNELFQRWAVTNHTYELEALHSAGVTTQHDKHDKKSLLGKPIPESRPAIMPKTSQRPCAIYKLAAIYYLNTSIYALSSYALGTPFTCKSPVDRAGWKGASWATWPRCGDSRTRMPDAPSKAASQRRFLLSSGLTAPHKPLVAWVITAFVARKLSPAEPSRV